MKRRMALMAVLLVMVIAVAAVCLWRQPLLVSVDEVESVVVSVTGKGHKEITDSAQQKQIIKLVNDAKRQKTSEDLGKGWNVGVYVFYADGTQETLWFAYEYPEDVSEVGVYEPTGEYMMTYQDDLDYRIADGTIVSLLQLCESLDTPYSAGILPTERMKEEELIE